MQEHIKQAWKIFQEEMERVFIHSGRNVQRGERDVETHNAKVHSRDKVRKESVKNIEKKDKEVKKTKMGAESIIPNKIQKTSEELQEELRGASKIAKIRGVMIHLKAKIRGFYAN